MNKEEGRGGSEEIIYKRRAKNAVVVFHLLKQLVERMGSSHEGVDPSGCHCKATHFSAKRIESK